MKRGELQIILRTADPSAVLIQGRILKRVIQQVCNLPTWSWKVPHLDCFVLDRHLLFRHVEQEELDLEPDQRLPSTVILLARPESEEMGERDPVLLKYWRRLFHAKVHFLLEEQRSEQKLDAGAMRQRIEQIGLAEFEEVRTVLQQEQYLPPLADDTAVYIEFAAVYLELKYFASNLLPVFFPGIRDLERIDALFARDLDHAALFGQTRLLGAPDPVVVSDTTSDLSHERYWQLIHDAIEAGKVGNTVQAALLRGQAIRLAPPPLLAQTRRDAEAELDRLTRRLQAALQLNDAEAEAWQRDFSALLDKSAEKRSAEASLLFDLQAVCVDHEREIYAVDVVEWLMSGGRRPIRRPLNSLRPVRIHKHLRLAASRLSLLRLSDQDRHHLSGLLQAAIIESDSRLRARFNPLLRDALLDVGLTPNDPPERVAFNKVLDELLDRLIDNGFLTFSDLRDVLSHNQLKLPDLGDPQEYIRGDPLLRLDRRLAIILDGVYRPSELYIRLLQRVSALNFGTSSGRAFTRYVTMPFGGSFLFIEGLEVLGHMVHIPPLLDYVKYALIIVTGFFLMGLLHVPAFRNRCWELTKTGFLRPLHNLWTNLLPRALPLEVIRQMITSWTFQLFLWYLLKPLIVCALIDLWKPEIFRSPLEAILAFLAANFLLNSRLGVVADEAVIQGMVQFYEALRAGLIPALFRLIIRLSKRVIDLLESLLYTVDEWLRLRGGEGRISLAVRAGLSLIWYPISYFARFYMVVLIEPCLNPIKFPISSIAYKLTFPLLVSLFKLMTDHLEPSLGGYIIYGFWFVTCWLLPDAFGFLFWETKENWSLYRANRSKTLRPISIGRHGESLRGLLRPGFHSGTVPRLFTRLRAAEIEACRTGNWHTVRTLRGELGEVQHIVRKFVAHEFVSLLLQSTYWRAQPVYVGLVELSYNRIRTEICHARCPDRSFWIEFEERAGWLMAGIATSGWLDDLTEEQSHALTTALASLYKLAGVGLVREQIRSHLQPDVDSFEVTPDQLTLWLDSGRTRSLTYDLHGPDDTLQANPVNGNHAADHPKFGRRRLIFAATPIVRQQWLDSWQHDQDGNGHPRLAVDGAALVLVERNGSPPNVNGDATNHAEAG